MPRYTFFLLTDEVHPKWRGPLQLRPTFRKTVQRRLDEDELRDEIIDRIIRDEKGKILPGEWMVTESMTGDRFMIYIDEDDVRGRWW